MDVFTYPADHGFNREASPAVYDEASAKQAFGRAVAFLQENIG